MTDVYEPSEARPWTPPQGHADIAPTRFERSRGTGISLSMRLGRAGAAADCLDSRPSSGAGRRPRASVARIAAPGSRSCRLILAVTRILSLPTSDLATFASSGRSRDLLGRHQPAL